MRALQYKPYDFDPRTQFAVEKEELSLGEVASTMTTSLFFSNFCDKKRFSTFLTAEKLNQRRIGN